MMFFKKLCRLNGSQTASARCDQDREGNNAARLERDENVSVRGADATLNHSTTRQRYAIAVNNTIANNTNNNNNEFAVAEAARFVNRERLLYRTPPPVYDCLPATPPPLYTPRSVEHVLAAGTLEEEEAVSLAVASPPLAESQVSQVRQLHIGTPATGVVRQTFTTRAPPPHVAANSRHAHDSPSNGGAAAEQQLTRQQQVRRRRLQLLQQQRSVNNPQQQQQQQQRNINNSSSESNSSESEAGFGLAARELRRGRRQRRAILLRDAYCPDLLNACSLILHQEPTSSFSSSVGSFTDTPPPQLHVEDSSESSSDYECIKEARRRRPLQAAYSTPHLSEDIPHPLQPIANHSVHNAQLVTVSGLLESRHSLSHNQSQRRVDARKEMGQNLSLRRPRISLTWVLREQQQQQQQQQTQSEQPLEETENTEEQAQNNNNAQTSIGQELKPPSLSLATQVTSPTAPVSTTSTVPKKRYRLKQLPGSTEPLNGYATTPTAHMPTTAMPQKFFSNQNLLEYRDKARRDLLFVCTPQRFPGGTKRHDANETLALAKKRNEIRKKLAAKMAAFQTNCRSGNNGDGAETATNTTKTTVTNVQNGKGDVVLEQDELKSLKGTYSEPSLVAVSEGHHRRHRHRKRRERNRLPKFGYEIGNVDEFLSKCSLATPGNIPVVLSASSTLYQTRPGGYQVEVPLPLGMVVNAVFKNQNWLYVQTPHAEEGYVGYACCLPLGILPPAARGLGSSSKPTPCWESNGDIFPRPCGNMTDSEKEMRLRGGTRSDGARTPRGKRSESVPATVSGSVAQSADAPNGNASLYGEHHVDKLYLRAASQPRLVEKAYAQLKATKNAVTPTNSTNDEYVMLQQHRSRLHVQKHLQQQQQIQQLHQKQPANGRPFVTNGHNGQHLHPPKNEQVAPGNTNNNNNNNNGNCNSAVHVQLQRKQQAGTALRQTLVAINTDYATESISLQRGEIVTLCECRESKDRRQWFYVRTRDGREGYIPAEVAGHGYL